MRIAYGFSIRTVGTHIHTRARARTHTRIRKHTHLITIKQFGSAVFARPTHVRSGEGDVSIKFSPFV